MRIMALLWWLLVIWLGGHRSGYPVHFGRYSNEYLAFLGATILAGLLLTFLALRNLSDTSPLRRARSIVSGIVLSLAVGLLATEGLVRWLDLFGASFYQEITRYILDLVPDPQLVYRHRENHLAEYQGVEVRTNELGLRDAPIVDNKGDELRVMVLGDSVAFGWGVQQDKVFSRIMEKRLEDALERDVQVINTGVCGYNTRQELDYLRNRGLLLKPDMLVLVYVDNDVDPAPLDIAAMRRQWNDPPGANGWLLRNSWLYRMFYHLAPHFLAPATAREQDSGWQQSRDALGEIAEISRTQGVPFLVFYFRLTAGEKNDALDAMLSAHAASEGYLYRDLLQLFSSRNIRMLTNSLVDIHPNAAGHELIGGAIAETIGGLPGAADRGPE
jgi:lysophospholipase L1-like esterase